MDMEMMSFKIVRNILVEQNRRLIVQLSRDYGLDSEKMLESYLRPEFYLPILYKKVTKIADSANHNATTT